MANNRRFASRVQFGHNHPVRIIAIDGTWFRTCTMRDVSNSGARLTVQGSLEGLDLAEFFLALSKVGQAHRRCELVWQSGDQIGLRFVKPAAPAGPSKKDADVASLE